MARKPQFDYADLDSDETRKIYRKLLGRDVTAFHVWKAETPTRRGLSVEGAFASWWLQKGNIAFRDTSHAVRYRQELLAAIQTVQEDI